MTGTELIFGISGQAGRLLAKLLLMQRCTAHSPSRDARFYNASSSECLGDTDVATDETTSFYPLSPYAMARFVAQKVIRAAADITMKRRRVPLVLGNLDWRVWGWAEEYVDAMRLILGHALHRTLSLRPAKASRRRLSWPEPSRHSISIGGRTSFPPVGRTGLSDRSGNTMPEIVRRFESAAAAVGCKEPRCLPT